MLENKKGEKTLGTNKGFFKNDKWIKAKDGYVSSSYIKSGTRNPQSLSPRLWKIMSDNARHFDLSVIEQHAVDENLRELLLNYTPDILKEYFVDRSKVKSYQVLADNQEVKSFSVGVAALGTIAINPLAGIISGLVLKKKTEYVNGLTVSITNSDGSKRGIPLLTTPSKANGDSVKSAIAIADRITKQLDKAIIENAKRENY